MAADPTDLEVIVTCLEVSAIELTRAPHAQFTKRQLFAGAKTLVPELDEADLQTVFSGMGRTFKRTGETIELR